jgi:hypothetical protein
MPSEGLVGRHDYVGPVDGRKGAWGQAQFQATAEEGGQEVKSFVQKSGRAKIRSNLNVKELTLNRRKATWRILAKSGVSSLIGSSFVAVPSFAADKESPSQGALDSAVLAALTGDTKSLFNEGRAKEMQGNVAAAQRIYSKVTKISPQVSDSSSKNI